MEVKSPASREARVDEEVFEGISRRLGIGVVLCDPTDTILWRSAWIDEAFPGSFATGAKFARQVRDVAAPLNGRTAANSAAPRTAGDTYRTTGDAGPGYFRQVSFPLGGPEEVRVRCFIDATREVELERAFQDHLQQLTSMKEIIDTLYESVSTEEVLYLILIAVTSQLGFGFNRAFYLEASGRRLRGRIGIGPSTPEDAHRIWGRLAELNLTGLRAIYEQLTLSDEPPDPHTREIARRMDFALRPDDAGLLGAIASRKAALIDSSVPRTDVDDALFALLDTDAVAVIPIHVRQSLAGVLIADNFVTRRRITDKALSLLKTLSGYAGVALERSQLYDELRDSVHKLQTANRRLKKNQRRLLQAEKLSAIGELAARVSHEIRNPVVAIGGLARSLLRDEDLSDDSRESAEIIVNEVTRLEKFLRETLHFARPEVVGARSVDLRDQIEECVSSLRPEIEAKAIEFEMRTSPVPLRSVVDPDLVHRALSNLLKNAIEAVGPGGTVRIESVHQGYAARIKVADSGPGVPPELRPRIFEPFFTTKCEGTGLGLAIAAQGIRSLGGRISLQESAEFRTIFTVTLPLEEAAAGSGRGPGRKEGRRSP